MEMNLFTPRGQVKELIRKWISEGSLGRGNMVPSEILISEQLNLSRGTVRTALEELEQEGVLEKRNHRRYVSDHLHKSNAVRDLVLLVGASNEDSAKFRNTGFGLAVQAGLLDALSERSKNVVSLHLDNINLRDIQVMSHLHPEGAIVMQKLLRSELGIPVLETLKAHGIPCVLEYVDDRYRNFDCVLCDHEQGTYELTSYALSLGCKNILCFYPDQTREYWFNARHCGYRRALKEAGIEPMRTLEGRPFQSEYEHTREAFDLSVRLCMGFLCDFFSSERSPDCILANSDWDASMVAAACRCLGKEPNRDVLIMGYDNKTDSNPWRQFEATTPLATLEKHNTRLGQMLSDTLFERIEGMLPPEPVQRLLKMDLIKLS